MKRILFYLSGFLFLSGYSTVNGQSILAGQTTGVAYTDITPDRVTPATGPVGKLSDSLDLNLDGTYDVKWTSRVVLTNPPIGQSTLHIHALMRPLHDNIEIAYLEYSPSPRDIAFISGFSPATIITTQPTPSVGYTSRWQGATNWNDAAMVYRGNGGGTSWYGSPGNFQSNADRYMGIRFRTTSTSPWRYGWVRVMVQTPPDLYYVSVTVKDYAFEQPILGTKKQAATSWQVYPTPVAHMLTVQSVTAGPKHATLLDTQGRVLLEAHFTTFTPEPLDLSRFRTGVYILRLTDEKGTITKCISKL